MLVNNTECVDRNNRPTVLQKVALRALFVNDGVYSDPNDISGVTIFCRTDTYTPNEVLSKNLISAGLDTDLVQMHFDGPAIDASSYDPGDPLALSSIYKTGTGQYVVILDGTQDLSGVYDFHGENVTMKNGASAIGEYVDAWTVQQIASGPYHTLLQQFELYEDTFFVSTEPIQVRAANKLVNKRVVLGSVTNLKIETEITVTNRTIDEATKNLFRQSAIANASVQIDKINSNVGGLPCHAEVSGYTDTSALVDITSCNTIIINFDTRSLSLHPNVADFGGLVGDYRITAKYSLLDEVIVTPPFYFTVS